MGDFAAERAFEELKKTVVEFKDANDKRLALIEKNGHAPADYKEKVEKISAGMDSLQEKIAQLETVVSRPATGAVAGEADEQAKQAAKNAFAKYMRKGSVSAEEHKAMTAVFPEAMKALSVDSDPDGGYLVLPERAAEMTKRVWEMSPMRQICGVQTIGSDAYEEVVDWDEVDAEDVGERDARSDSGTPQLGKLRIETKEMTSSPKATQKILDDAGINLEQWLSDKVDSKFARKEGNWFINGDGLLQAKGFLGYATTSTDEHGKVEQVLSGTAGTFSADNLVSVQDALYEPFQAGARWVMRRATRTQVRQMKDGQGQYLFKVERGLTGGFEETILEKPVTLMPDMPAVGANALAIAYGDFKQGYLIVDRIGIRVLRDPYTAKPNVVFYTTKRVGGGVRQFQAIKILKLAAA